jgi:purine nucleosidase
VRRIIIDVDTGIDDALALIVAATLGEQFDLLAVTTVAGNADLAAVTQNTRAVLGLLGRSDISVAAGAATPLLRPLRTAPHIHGPGGLGTIDPDALTPRPAALYPESAAEMIARLARTHPGEITIIATGPLTNLALALHMDPPLASRLAGIVIMGGAITVPGNASPVAEANFLTDPEAARIVLSSGAPITLVPLDVTERVRIDRTGLDNLRQRAHQRGSIVGRFAADVLAFYLRAYEQHGQAGAALHDPLAVALLARPDLGTATPLHVQIAVADPLTAGQCIVDRRPTPPEHILPSNVRCYLQVMAEAARDFILDLLLGPPGVGNA